MPLNEYRCPHCKSTTLRFEEFRFMYDGQCDDPRMPHEWELMPPRANIVFATAQYMQEYQLDSWATVYELDRQLNIEAREARELDFYQDHKRNA